MRSLLEKRHQRLVHAKNFAIFVHCLLGLLALQATLPGVSAAVASDVDPSIAEKRNWHQLQGAWGKRNYLEGENGNNDEPEEVIIPEQWIPMVLSGGPGSEPAIIYVPKASSMYSGYDNNDFLSGFDADSSLNKVKRRNRQLMNRNSAAAYGKREPNWNNLKGMWGKRSAKDWASLTGTWGRR